MDTMRKTMGIKAALCALAAAAAAWAGLAAPSRASAEITFLNGWGSHGSGDGQFFEPRGVAVGLTGRVYVADRRNNRIQRFSGDGVFEMKWGTQGHADGQFDSPYGVAVGPTGQVYVAEADSHRIQRFSEDGVFEMKWGTYGSAEGQFANPLAVSVGPGGRVYVCDHANYRIQRFDADGAFQKVWGHPGYEYGEFTLPRGVAVSSTGLVYVADTNEHRIQRFDADGTFQTGWGRSGPGDGEFARPMGVAVGSTGLVYVADTYNDRIQRFGADGTFQTKWGSHGSGDGQFNSPYGVAVGPTGLVYVADKDNNRVQRFFDSDAWLSGTNVFIDPATGPVDVGVGNGEMLGPSLTLDSAKSLVVGGTTTVAADGVLTLAGGSLTTGALAGLGLLHFDKGALHVTGAEGLSIGSSGPLGAKLTLSEGRALAVTATATVEADALLVIADGTFSADATCNAGRLVVPGETLDFGPGGLTNTGELALIDATVSGSVTSPAGSAINVIGTVTFNGPVNGAGGIFGSGTAVFNGGYSPGDSAGIVPVEGNIAFGVTNTLTLEVASTDNSDPNHPGYDALEVQGGVALGGMLKLVWLPAAGDPTSKFGGDYDVITCEGGLVGGFEALESDFAPAYVAALDQIDLNGDDSPDTLRLTLHGLLDGDADLDGDVDFVDYIKTKGSFGTLTGAEWSEGDSDLDGDVDFADYVATKSNFGSSVTGGAVLGGRAAAGDTVPEPATLLLLAAAATILPKRRPNRQP